MRAGGDDCLPSWLPNRRRRRGSNVAVALIPAVECAAFPAREFNAEALGSASPPSCPTVNDSKRAHGFPVANRLLARPGIQRDALGRSPLDRRRSERARRARRRRGDAAPRRRRDCGDRARGLKRGARIAAGEPRRRAPRALSGGQARLGRHALRRRSPAALARPRRPVRALKRGGEAGPRHAKAHIRGRFNLP